MAAYQGSFLMDRATSHVGQELAVTDWLVVDQPMVSAFGDLTRHHHWLHLDPARAESEGPYGTTLVQGLLLLSLVVHFNDAAGLRPADAAYSLNYGFDRVRFIAPVPTRAGVRVRDRIRLLEAEWRDADRLLLKTAHEIEAEGVDGPAVYAEWLALWLRARAGTAATR